MKAFNQLQSWLGLGTEVQGKINHGLEFKQQLYDGHASFLFMI